MTTYQSLCPTDLITVLMTLGSDAPHVTLLRHDQNTPTFEESHHSLQKSLRHWAEQRTGCPIGHMEQLYTFSTFPTSNSPAQHSPAPNSPTDDISAKNTTIGTSTAETQGERLPPSSPQPGPHVLIPHIHVTYMALSHARSPLHDEALYHHFPWEDRRNEQGNQQLLRFVTAISQWAAGNEERMTRIAAAFGLAGLPWDDTRVLERYELLWESGLVPQNMPRPQGNNANSSRPAMSDQPDTPGSRTQKTSQKNSTSTPDTERREAAETEEGKKEEGGDVRRLFATALSRLRARIRYSPAVFDLLPASFTLLQLQQAMETVSGRHMHKPNFRRLVLHQQLVEETGALEHSTAGRPARLYRFRPAAMASCYLGAAFLPLEPLTPEEGQTAMAIS